MKEATNEQMGTLMVYTGAHLYWAMNVERARNHTDAENLTFKEVTT